MQGGPHDHINAAKAVAFGEALRPDFKLYARQIVKNAKALADELMAQGVKLVTNGTDNHLVVIDLRTKGLTGKGKDLQHSLDEAGITVNKNTVPYEPSSPFYPSGLRMGTPALTTRGMKDGEMKDIARWIAKVIDNHHDEKMLAKIREEVKELCKQFPLYPGLSILK